MELGDNCRLPKVQPLRADKEIHITKDVYPKDK